MERRRFRIPLGAVVVALAASLVGAPPGPAVAADGEDCQQVGRAWLITAECTDPEFAEPLVTAESEETLPTPHHRISGTVGGREFTVYLPPAESWKGRLFQRTYPLQSAQASDETIAFGIASGAGTVQVAGASGYRAEAAAVKFAKSLAAEHYGSDAEIHAYLYGGSGGSYPTIGAAENTTDIWDGFVPFVIGTPTAIPNTFFSRALARFVLEEEAPAIADAMLPGGSGDPYATLDNLQADVLTEVTRLGLPLAGWIAPDYLLQGTSNDALLGFGETVRRIDSSYENDFWTAPGYLGTEETSLGDYFRSHRIVADSSIASFTRDGGGAITAITVTDLPHSEQAWIPLDVSVLEADGTKQRLSGSLDSASGTFTLGENSAEAIAALVEGATIRFDNSWSLALFAYERHQTPTALDFHAWNQHRNVDGSAKYPTRPLKLGEVLAGSISGGAAYSGKVTAKTIMVGNLLDVDAYSWHADWYAKRAQQALGSSYDDTFRVWYLESADHLEGPVTGTRSTYVVSFEDVLQQALRDISAWAESDIEPPASTAYGVTDDAQISVDAAAATRGGIQPTVNLTVAGEQRVDVEVGQPTSFAVQAAAPPGTGQLVRIEWDLTGTGTWSAASLDSTGTVITATAEQSYPTPGTYFAAVRVTTDRNGEADGTFAQVKNLDRVRVIVHEVAAPHVSIASSPESPDGNDGWYRSPVTLSTTATDDVDQDPDVEIDVDGHGFVPQSGPITLDSDGEHTARVRATDSAASSAEAEWSGRIDQTAPAAHASIDATSGRVAITGDDATSGLDTIEYAEVDDAGRQAAWQAYSSPVQPATATTGIVYRATDVAGNTSAAASISLISTVPTSSPPPSSQQAAPEEDLATTGVQAAGWIILAIALLGGGILFSARRRPARR